jgi:hypothetical protein
MLHFVTEIEFEAEKQAGATLRIRDGDAIIDIGLGIRVNA